MNTKKIAGAMLLFAFLITAGFSLTAGCCSAPGPEQYDTVQAPNGENLRYALSSCGPPVFEYIEVHKRVLIMQGNVAAGSVRLPDKHNRLSLTPRTNAGFVVQEEYSSSFRPVNDQSINDMYTGFTKALSKESSSAKNASATDAIEKKYSTQQYVPISADFTGKLYVFSLDTYTLGVKKNTEQKILGAPSTLLYTDQITRFTGVFGNALATRLTTNGVQFLDTKQVLPVGATNMFFKESEVALESVRRDLFEFYYDQEFSETLDPATIRALMQAAEAVNDPRLLIIERATTSDNLKITAFGAEAFNAAMPTDGYRFIWDFTGANLQKIITDDLLRAIQVEYTKDSVQ